MADVKSWLSRVFRSRDNAAASSATPADTGPVIPPSAWDAGIELSLGQIASQIETKASGRVQVITLAHLRHSLGDNWDQYRAHVLLIAETTIGRKIGKGNTFIPHDEDSWLLLMPSLSEEEAEARAIEIGVQLGEKLIGERFSEEEPPLPQSAKVDLSTAMRQDGTLDMDAIRQAVKKARMVLAAREAKRTSTSAKTAPVNPLDAVSAPAHSRFSEIKLVYRQAWSSDTEAIDTFHVRGFDSMAELVYGRADARLPSILNDPTMADIVKAAISEFVLMISSGLRAKYVLAIPYTMTRRRVGDALFRTIAALPQQDRLMHLRVEFTGLPPNVSPEHLFELRETFRGRVREVAFLLDLAALRDQVLALDHIVLGADVNAAKFADEQQLRTALIAFRRRVGPRRAYVMGLRSRELISAAVGAGYDEVSGGGLADDTRHLPLHTTVIHRQDLTRISPGRLQ
jgi:hypothetical protein